MTSKRINDAGYARVQPATGTKALAYNAAGATVNVAVEPASTAAIGAGTPASGFVAPDGLVAASLATTQSAMQRAIAFAGSKVYGYLRTVLDATGATDMTAALNTAAALAVSLNMGLELPSGTLLANGALTFGPLRGLRGAGKILTTINSTVTGATDALTLGITTSVSMGDISGFTLLNTTPGNGGYGLRITLASTRYYANFHLYDLHLEDFGKQGLYLDNSIANNDGFFTGRVEGCYIANGILGTFVGDSITFRDNNIPGNRSIAGVYPPSLKFSGLSGARQVLVYGNSMTCRGGALSFTDVHGAEIRRNQMEHPTYLGNYGGADDAQVYLSGCLQTQLDGNTIVSGDTCNTSIRLAGACDGVNIKVNDIDKFSPGDKHIVIAATCARTRWHNDNILDAPLNDTNLSSTTYGMWYPLTLVNSWADAIPGVYVPPSYIRLPSGLVQIRGTVGGGTGTIATLPDAFAPSGYVRFPTGDGVAQVAPAGSAAITIITAAQTDAIHLNAITYYAEAA